MLRIARDATSSWRETWKGVSPLNVDHVLDLLQHVHGVDTARYTKVVGGGAKKKARLQLLGFFLLHVAHLTGSKPYTLKGSSDNDWTEMCKAMLEPMKLLLTRNLKN